MCGSFTCSKNTLVGLNVIYILVSFLMIGVAVHGKKRIVKILSFTYQKSKLSDQAKCQG